MKHSPRATRARQGALVLVLAALAGGGLVVPSATPAAADEATAADVTVPTASLINTGTSWKFLDDNTDPAAGSPDIHSWAAPSFDDSAWKTGVSGFGVKRNELEPVGPHMPATKLEHYIEGTEKSAVPTYFFRTSFTLDSGVADLVDTVEGRVLYDDGLRVFVNGELVRGFADERVDDKVGNNLQYAGTGASNPSDETFVFDGDVLKDGENTVAVALYQDRISSSDAYFDFTELKLVKELEPGEIVAAPPTRVILTPTESPSTSQSFSWLGGHTSHEAGQIEIGLAAGGETRVIDAKVIGQVGNNQNVHFSQTVDGLTPATAYRYRVGLPGSWSDWYTFTTEDPSATDFQFIYYGDAQIGLDTTWPKVVKQAEERAPRSIGSVHAGDLIDTSSNDTQWQNWFKGMEHSATSTNVMAAPGNHEYSGDKLMQAWKAHFEYPLNQPDTESIGELAELAQGDSPVAKQYKAYFEHWAAFAAETVYYADYQNVRFITLNATRDTTFLTPAEVPACSGEACPSTRVADLWTEYQAAWLDYVLKNSKSKWNVVTFHQPVYSTSSGRNEPVLRKHWVPVFEENNIDLVLMGHDHTYARGYNNDDSTDTVGRTVGPVYAVSNSGAKHYNLETEEKNVWTNNGATQVLRASHVTTYQVIDVSQDQLVYRSYVAERRDTAASWAVDTTGASERPVYVPKDVPAEGELFDEVTVTKYASGEKFVTESGVEIPGAPQLSASATEVKQGEQVTFSGTGFKPGTEVKVQLHSTPVELGTATVASDRTFSLTVEIPANTPADVEHSLVALLPNGASYSLPITVLAAAVDPGGSGGGTGGGSGGSGQNPGEQPVERPADKPAERPAEKPQGGLADTGLGALMPLLFTAGGVTLLAGAALLVARRRARAAEMIVGE